jgi:hypothetical protein
MQKRTEKSIERAIENSYYLITPCAKIFKYFLQLSSFKSVLIYSYIVSDM